MKWDWAVDTFKALLAAAAMWIANWLRKNAIPYMKELQRYKTLLDRVERLEIELSIEKSKGMAGLYVDPAPVFITNMKGEVIFVNPAWLEMTGLPSEKDAIGFGFMKVIPQEDREALEYQAELLMQHPGTWVGTVRFKHWKSKQIINTTCVTEVVHDRDGRFIETVGKLKITH